MLLGAVHLGHLVFVEHTKVPDERRQSGPEPGRSDHSVDLHPRAVGEERRPVLESLIASYAFFAFRCALVLSSLLHPARHLQR